MREALASLRQLAQQLPPRFAEFGLIEQPLRRSAALPGVGGGATPTGLPGVGGGARLCGTPSGTPSVVSRVASPTLSFTPSLSGSASPPVIVPSTARRYDASPPSESAVPDAVPGVSSGATPTAELPASAGAHHGASTRPVTEIRSRPPRGAAAQVAAVQSAELDAAQILSTFPSLAGAAAELGVELGVELRV